MANSYSATVERRNGTDVVTLRAADRASAVILPEFGNNCVTFEAGRPILEAAPLAKILEKPTAWGIPLLFPFPNRIRDGVFRFKGREYRLDVLQHGFVRHRAWRLVATGADPEQGAWSRASLDAADHPTEILATFPFPFRLEVTHRLQGDSLELVTDATNTGTEEMPCGFGIHPYFQSTEATTVLVPARRRWEIADKLPTGRLVDLDARTDLKTPRPARELELDDVYTDVLPDADGTVRYVLDDGPGGRTVIACDPLSLPDVVAFTPPRPRPAICIEPQSCPTDAFNLAERGVDAHVVVLPPKGSVRWTISIRSERPAA